MSQSGHGQSGDCEANWFTASQDGHVNPVIVKQIDLPWVNPVTVNLVIVKQIDLPWVNP